MLQTSKLLINESPFLVQRSLIVALGNRVDDALVLQQLHYWLQRSDNEADGRRWVYNTYEEWTTQDFPFYNEGELGRIFRRLRDLGVVIAKPINVARWDRRYWYTIDYDVLDALLQQPGQPKAKPKDAADRNSKMNSEEFNSPEFKNESSRIQKQRTKNSKTSALHHTKITAETTTETLGADAPTLPEPVSSPPAPPTKTKPARKEQAAAPPSKPSAVEWDDIPAAPVEARDKMTVQQAEVGAWAAVMGLDVGVPANAKRVGNMLVGLRKSNKCQPTVDVARDRFGRMPPADGSWNFYTETWQGKRGQFPTEREINQYWGTWLTPTLRVVKPARAAPSDEQDGIDEFLAHIGQPNSNVIEGRVIRGNTA